MLVICTALLRVMILCLEFLFHVDRLDVNSDLTCRYIFLTICVFTFRAASSSSVASNDAYKAATIALAVLLGISIVINILLVVYVVNKGL